MLAGPVAPPDNWRLLAHSSPAHDRVARRLAWWAAAAVVIATLTVGMLHVLPPTSAANPMSRTISEYSLYSDGWAFDAAVILLASGSAAVALALLAAGLTRWPSWALVMIGLWCVGLVGLIFFPKQGFGADSTFAGRVHWTWTLLAFFSLPIGAPLCCWRRGPGLAPGPWPRWVAGLSFAAAGWFVILAVQTVVGALGVQTWHWVGLVERGLSVTEMATVLVLAIWVLSMTGRSRLPDEAEPGPGSA